MLLWAFLALLTEPAGWQASQYGCLMMKTSRALLAVKVAASWVVVHCCRKLQVVAETKLTLHVQPWIHIFKNKVMSMLFNHALLMILCLFSVTMVRMVCCSSVLSFSNSSRLEKYEAALNRNRCVSILHQYLSFFLCFDHSFWSKGSDSHPPDLEYRSLPCTDLGEEISCSSYWRKNLVIFLPETDTWWADFELNYLLRW